MAAAGAALLFGLVLLLQVDSVSTMVGRWVTGAISGPGMEISAGRLTGSWIRGLKATDFRISSFTTEGQEDGRKGASEGSAASGRGPGWEVTADTLWVGFRLLPLFKKTVTLTQVEGAGVRVLVRLSEGDTAKTEQPEAAQDSAGGAPWTVLAEGVSLRRGALRMETAETPGDTAELNGPWILDEITLLARDLEIGDGVEVVVDSLLGRLLPLGMSGPRGRILAVGGYRGDGLQIDTLLLETDSSHVAARGRLPLAGSWPPSDGLDFHLSAEPLHLRDLGPFLPASLPDSIRLEAQGHAVTKNGNTSIDVRLETPGSGRLVVQGDLGGTGSGGGSTLSLRLRELELATWGMVQDSRELDLTLEARADSLTGPWEGEWSGGSRGVEAGGTVGVTFGEKLAWQVSGEGSWNPAAGAPPLPSLDSTGLALAFRGDGQGTSPDDLQGQGEVRMTSGSLFGGIARDLVLQAEVTGGTARFSLGGGVGGGSLTGEGQVDLKALPTLRASGEISLAAARYQGVQVDSLALQAEARDSLITLVGSLSLPDSGWARMAATASTGPAETRVVLDSLRFSRLDVRSLMNAPDSSGIPATRLAGLLRGRGQLADGGFETEALLQLDSSRVGAQPLQSGEVEARLDSEGGTVTMSFHTPRGGVDGQVSIDAWRPHLGLTVPEIRFRELDPGALLGQEPENTLLTGTLRGEFQGGIPDQMTGQVFLALDSSRVAGRPLAYSTLDAEIRDARAQVDLAVESAGVVLQIEGHASLGDSTPSYTARGTVQRPATPESAFAAEFNLDGRGIQPDSMEVRARFEVDSARWNEVALDTGYLEASMAEGVFRLDTLTLESPAASISGGGMLPLSSEGTEGGEVRLTGVIHRADMLAGLVGAQLLALGEASFEATASGALRDLDLSGQGRISALLMDENQLRGGSLRLTAHYAQGEGFTGGEGELTVDRLQAGSFSLQSLQAQANLMEEGQELAVTASAVIDGSREAGFSLRVEDLPAPSAIRVEELEFRVDQDEWRLVRPARVTFRDGISIDSLALEAEDQALRARGRVGSTGPLSLVFEAEDFRIGTVSDLLGVPALQGKVSGTVALSGTADLPEMEARVQANLEASDVPASRLDLTATYRNRSLDFQAEGDMAGSGGFRGEGSLPLALSLADTSRGILASEAMRISAQVDSLPLAWAGLFLSPELVRNLEGVAHGSLQVDGSPGDPALEGALNLEGVNVGLPSLGVRYGSGMAQMRFSGKEVILDTLSVHSGDGTLHGSGTVAIPTLTEPEYDLRIRVRDFRAMASSGIDAVVSGNVEISGISLSPSITGRLEVLHATVYLDDLVSEPDVEAISLSEEDYRELARVFGYRAASRAEDSSDLFRNVSLQLTVALRRDSWIRKRTNPEMAVQLSGDLSVEKAPGESLRLMGEVSAVSERSYVEQFGRRFFLTQGDLVFQGSPLDTRVDLRAEYEVPSRDNPQSPEVTIALNISGTPEDLRLELSSTPSLEASDMVSYLAVGRPADRSLGGGGGSLGQTGEALALGRLSGAVEAYAREQVGLDVVEITTDGLEGVTLLAGRYVSPTLYLGVRQPISLQRGSGEASERTPDPEFEVEFQAVRWLLLNLQAGGRGGVEFFVRSRIAYE